MEVKIFGWSPGVIRRLTEISRKKGYIATLNFYAIRVDCMRGQRSVHRTYSCLIVMFVSGSSYVLVLQ